MSDFFIREFYTNYDNGKAVDYVVISPRGEAAERVATPHRIKDLMPPKRLNRDAPSHQALLARWAIIEPAYMAWKKEEAIPEDGTPLAAWSALSPSQAEHLKRAGATTVEHVRDLSPEFTARLPWPDARKLPKLAAEFLSGRDRASAIAENEALKERLAALEELLANQEPKRGPGRPKKEEAA